MPEIDNISVYQKRMAAAMADKCWWVEHLRPEVDTVVDFGCAQGDLALYIEQRWPGRFTYIGVDESPRMLELARENMACRAGMERTSFCRTVVEAARQCDPLRAVLVVNSVLHEVFSYMRVEERHKLLSDMFSLTFHYVAIRDMYMPRLVDGHFDAAAAISAVEASRWAPMWREYNAWLDGPGHRRDFTWQTPSMRVTEFLLKYRYADNWAREMRETYLWKWQLAVEPYWWAESYAAIYDEHFSIAFLRQQIKRDFGIDFPVDTHRKILLRLGGNNEWTFSPMLDTDL